MKKLFLFAFIALFVILPVSVSADSCSDCPHSEEEKEEWVNRLVTFKQKGDETYVEIPVVAFPTAEGYSDEELALSIVKYIYEDKDDTIDVLGIDLENKTIRFYIRYMVEVVQGNFPVVGDSGNTEIDPSQPLYTMKWEERTYPFELITEYDNSDLTSIQSIVNGLEDSYSITDLASINLMWNYGLVDIVSNYARRNNLLINDSQILLYSYQDLKNLILKNPDYSFDIKLLGDAQNGISSTGTVQLIVKKDGVVYGSRIIDLCTDYFLRVDKDAEGTIQEKVENRLKSYFGDNVEFYLKPFDSGEEFDDDGENVPAHGFYLYFEKDAENIHEYYESFCDHSAPYCIDSPFSKVSSEQSIVGDTMAKPYYTILGVEVDGSKVKDAEVSAYDNNTGIKIVTDSYDVPLDTLIQSEDKSSVQDIISLLSQYKIIGAYEIDIVGIGNGTKIKEIANGVEVYIPIEGYKEGDTVLVKHIKEDGTLGEEIQAEVVKIDNQLYAKFLATHFSTYAVVDDELSNPPTLDSVMKQVSIIVLSTIIICGSYIYLRRERTE